MIDTERVVVVMKEIESWYLAGFDDTVGGEMGIPSLPSTEEVTKEDFREMVPKRFRSSAVDFMAEILSGYRVEIAKDRNRSFCYLMDLLEKTLRGA